MIFNESIYNSHWNTKKLNELGTFNRGKSKHRPRNDSKLFIDGIYPFIQTGDIKNSILYITSHTQNYNELGLAQSKLWNKGTLCITIASNIADTAVLAYPMCFPDSVVGFIANPTESSEIFMHYIFTYIQKYIQNSVIGSIQDNINIDYLQNLEFKIPSKEYQEKITFILSSIDKKIELNNKITSELESMAKTIYDYWFLQFEFPNAEGKPYKSSGGKMVWNEELKKEIPDNWEIKKLGQLIIENKKSSLQVSQIKNNSIGEIPFFTSGSTILYTSNYLVNGQNCFLNTGGNADVKNYYGKASYSTDTWCITSNEETIYYLSMYLLSIKNILDIKYFQGTGLKHLQKDLLKNTKIVYPNKLLLEKFNNLTKNLFIKSSDILRENQELTSLRDYLLPLLMNGQVGFKE